MYRLPIFAVLELLEEEVEVELEDELDDVEEREEELLEEDFLEDFLSDEVALEEDFAAVLGAETTVVSVAVCPCATAT